MHQLISPLWLHLQVVFCHGSRNHSWGLILVSQQYALVEISIAMLQADSYDACILGLGVISWGLIRGARKHRRKGDRASVGAGGPG